MWGCGQLLSFTAPWASWVEEYGGVSSCRVTWLNTSLRSRLGFWLDAVLAQAATRTVVLMRGPNVTLSCWHSWLWCCSVLQHLDEADQGLPD